MEKEKEQRGGKTGISHWMAKKCLRIEKGQMCPEKKNWKLINVKEKHHFGSSVQLDRLIRTGVIGHFEIWTLIISY